MATLTVFSSSGDGYLESKADDNTWEGARTRSSASGVVDYTSTIATSARTAFVNNEYYEIDRAFLPFDTSSLPDDATVTAATLSIWVNSVQDTDSQSLSLVLGTQASTSSLVAADYSQVGTVKQATDLTIASLVTGTYNTFNLNSTGISNINLAGFTKFALRISNDISGSPVPTGNNSAPIAYSEETGTAKDPKLEITYTQPTTTSTTTSSSTSTTSTSSSTTKTDTTTTTSTTTTSTSTTTTSTSSTSSSTSSTSSSTSSTSSSTTSTSSSTTMPFSMAVDNV